MKRSVPEELRQMIEDIGRIRADIDLIKKKFGIDTKPSLDWELDAQTRARCEAAGIDPSEFVRAYNAGRKGKKP